MTKKNSLIILTTSIVLIVASIISVVIFFSLPKTNQEISNEFYVSCENVTGYIDEWTDIPLKVSDKDATIVFDILDESIAYINNNQVIALKPGITFITITATKNDKKAICNFMFTAKYHSCQFEIIANLGCYYSNQQLTVQESSCQFTIKFTDDFGNVVSNPNIQIITDPNLSLKKTAFGYILTTEGDGTITFIFVDYNYEIVVDVKNQNVL